MRPNIRATVVGRAGVVRSIFLDLSRRVSDTPGGRTGPRQGGNMRIGVLTGGGDAPGLNAAIRGVTRRALEGGDLVVGIKNGWAGLLGSGDTVLLTPRAVDQILQLGGTILGTSRTNPLKNPLHLQEVLDNVVALDLDALVPIGGDDTLSVAYELHRRGVKVVG